MTYDLRRLRGTRPHHLCPAHPPQPGHRHLARDGLGRFPCHELNWITSASPAAGAALPPDRRITAGEEEPGQPGAAHSDDPAQIAAARVQKALARVLLQQHYPRRIACVTQGPRRHAAGPLGGGRRAASLYARLPPAKNRRPQQDAGELQIEAARQSPLYLDLPTVVVDLGLPRLPRRERPSGPRGRRPGVGPVLAGSAGRGRRRADVVKYWTGYCAGPGWEPGAAAALLEDVADRALRSEFKPDNGARAGVVAEAVGDQSAQRPVITGSGDVMKVTTAFQLGMRQLGFCIVSWITSMVTRTPQR